MNPYYEPPWKASLYKSKEYHKVPGDLDIWCVTTDRRDPSDEYDVNEDAPEWVVKLEAAAPKLLELCKNIVKRYDEIQYPKVGPPLERSPLLDAIDPEIDEIENFVKEMGL